MCGLVALAGAVPPDVARAAVAGAAARGPHSSGWARYGPGLGWIVDRWPGRLPPPDIIDPAYPIQVGHSRLATTGDRPGDAPDPNEGQPLRLGSWLLAHNGTVAVGELPARHEAELYRGPVDSGLLLNHLATGDLETASRLPGRLKAPQALIWASPRGLYAMRLTGVRVAAHPLYATVTDTYAAVSSAPLPDGRLLDPDRPHLIWSI